MILRLRVRPSDESKLLLGHALFGRLLYIGIALFLALGMAALREAPPGLLALTAISLLAGLYEERWAFDRKAGTASRIRGIGPVSRRLTLPLGSLKSIMLRVVSSPSPEETPSSLHAAPVIPESLRRGRAVLVLAIDSGEAGMPGTRTIVLEDGSHRERDRLEGLGRAIAEYCGIPLHA
jgi:hypothetical protein